MAKLFLGSLILIFVSILAQTNATNDTKLVYCYWGTWSHYRPGDGKFQVENIDPFLCTHIGYSFFGLKDGEITSLDSWLDFDLKNVEKTVALKKVNPNLKIMAAIGGWNEGSVKYSEMVSTKEKRSKFISSVVDFLLKYGFDGFDGDWEYPTQRGGSPDDRANFVLLLKELKAALEPHNLQLAIAVAAGEEISNEAYDIPGISKYVDLINVMTYDYVVATDPQTGFNAPLRGAGGVNVETSIKYWLQKGAPAKKILLGIPFYGHTYTLANSTENTPGSPVTGGGNPGPYTQTSGFLGYNEICVDLPNGWTKRWDTASYVPYAFKGNQWIGYDDVESIYYKVSFLKSLNLAGAMIWSIETDDFHGLCGEKNPLLNTINKNLKGKSSGLLNGLKNNFITKAIKKIIRKI